MASRRSTLVKSMRLGYDDPMRQFPILMMGVILIPWFGGGCQKAEPRSTADRPYEAERIKTLTHDVDLQAPKATGPANLREAAEALRTETK
jgi:hypothetical protein